MQTASITTLSDLNKRFYETTAIEFHKSREYFWEGWEKILPLLDAFDAIRVGDIGCGNGRFGSFLFERCPDLKLSYTGIEQNPTLLALAQTALQGKIPALHFQEQDIVSALLDGNTFLGEKKFQLLSCFGVFHHIPSFALRVQLLKQMLDSLTPDGYIVISFWQFFQFERFRKKIISDPHVLETHGISTHDLEHNDYILDWKRGAQALRYCHYADADEQQKLFLAAGAVCQTNYFADGKEGRVNQYAVVQKK